MLKPTVARPRLLVSVRDASEARLARSLGVPWIDLKDPDAGSLGAPDPQVAKLVAQELNEFQYRSAAAGEMVDGAREAVTKLAPHFPIVKVGLSGLGSDPYWANEFGELSRLTAESHAQIVPVIYADYSGCHAPHPSAILEVAARTRAPYVLIDTCLKDGRGLLSYLKIDEIRCIIQSAADNGSQIVLAGSLSLSDLVQLIDLPVAAIAVRGAVCHGDRRSQICSRKIEQWMERLGISIARKPESR
jgi:uncharacterized protein (UPF0264 family)